jgi:hypothetical protein
MGRVVSVKDIDYPIEVNAAYHPALLKGATERIVRSMEDTKWSEILRNTLMDPATMKVWGVVIEEDSKPKYALQNLAFTKTSLPFRRVLRVNILRT